MHFIDGNKRRLQCDEGEVITVRVTPNDQTVNAVSMGLNGATLTGGTFTIHKAQHPISSLFIMMTFSNPNGGGAYTIRVSGSAGGDVSEDTVNQTQNPVTHKFRMEDARAYLFF